MFQASRRIRLDAYVISVETVSSALDFLEIEKNRTSEGTLVRFLDYGHTLTARIFQLP
jgi:hypothetical protein